MEAAMGTSSPEHPDAIIARIAERRNRAGQSLDTLPDTPAEVIGWVAAHPDAPESVLRADVLDCFALDYWLRVTLDRRRLALHHLGRPPGGMPRVTWREIADAQHLATPQAAQMQRDRLQGHREEAGRSEKALRSKHSTELREEVWLEDRAGDIRAAAKALVAASPDGAPEVAEELDDPASTIRTLMVWVAHELRGHSPGLCPPAEALVAEWDGLNR